MRMRKERSVEVVKVCTKNLFIHHHPTSTLVFVRALWSRICEILIGSGIVTHPLQKRKGEKKIYENDELPKILDLLKTQEIYLPISAIIFLFVLTFILRKFFFKK